VDVRFNTTHGVVFRRKSGIRHRWVFSEMENRMQRLILSGMLLLLAPGLSAVELPAPAELLKQMGVSGHYVTVVEPHQSDSSHQTHVTYLAVRANQVLDHLFGHQWLSPDNDVVFSAADGYQFAGGAERFARGMAYLAYAHADGSDFTLVNKAGQRRELGPYYLIWDNIADPSLIKQGAYGWPYAVLQVDVRPVSAYAPLLPASASTQVRDGFVLFKEYCLICHQVAGIGGEKLATDLRQVLCPLKAADLRALIDNPGDALRMGGMPPLDEGLQGEERRQTIDLIMAYLQALQPEGQPCQTEKRTTSF
jgi:mono/diheme cytochrome c family protein